MKKSYFIVCLSLASIMGINIANATVVIITSSSSPTQEFIPAIANAVCGDTIKWVNGSGVHTTASTTIPIGATSWDSPPLTTSGFIYVVTIAGTYNYTCHPLNGGHMDASIVVTCTTGITSIGPNNPSLAYPNPFSDLITFETATGDMIILYNLLGDKVKSVSLEDRQTKIDVDGSDLTKGIYFYNIINEGVIIERKKLVKK